MKEIMPKADKPVSLQKLDTWVAAYPPFSFDLIIDDLIQALNRLWSGPFFHQAIVGLILTTIKYHTVVTNGVYTGGEHSQQQKKISLDWLHNLALSTKNDVQIKGYDEKCSQQCSSFRAGRYEGTVSIFLDRGYLDISKIQNTYNITNLIQLMIRLRVKCVGVVKNTAFFPFLI